MCPTFSIDLNLLYIPQFKMVIPFVLSYVLYFLKTDLSVFFNFTFLWGSLLSKELLFRFQNTVALENPILFESENGKVTFLIAKGV